MSRAFYRKNKGVVGMQPTTEEILKGKFRLAFLNGMKNEEKTDEIEERLQKEYPEYAYAIKLARIEADWIFKTN